MSADGSVVSSVEHGGFQIDGSGSAETALESLKSIPTEQAKGEEKEPEKDPVSAAASELGKRGGKAAAKARKEAAKEAEGEKEPAKAAEPEKAAETKPGDGEGSNEQETEAEERKSRAAERVRQATRDAAEAKREAQRLRERLEALERERNAPQRPQDAPRDAKPEPPKGKPKSEDFESYDEYLDARDAWNKSQWEAEREQRDRARSEQAEVQGVFKAFQESTRAAASEDPDFWDSVPQIDSRTPLGHEILRSGKSAPGILRYLGENPDVYEKISQIQDLREVIREVGKIEDRLERATTGNPRSVDQPESKPAVSKAPPPVKPVTGAPSVAPGQYREGMSLDDYAKGWKPAPTR